MRRYYLILFLLLFACRNHPVEKLIIKGSDTEINLVMAEAESFMEKDSAVSISITGGGSGIGITALFNKRCNIALSSRPLNPYEEALAMRRGIYINATIFAKDAIAIIVNPQVEVKSISLSQLAKIFSGEITNWNQLGGHDGEISLYGRQSSSGTYNFLKDNVMTSDFAPGVKQLSGTGQIVEAIKQDKNGIGYVGIGYIVDQTGKPNREVKILSLQPTDTSAAISPLSKLDIYSGRYPLTRPLYQFTIGKPTGKVKEFIDFQLSAAGQKIIEENGFFSIKPQQQAILQ